jgi:opacity protein-like surface antigen
MRVRSVVGGLAAASICLSGPAFAVDATQVGRKLAYDETRMKVGVDVRAGLGGYTGDLGAETGVGPTFGINAEADPWPLFGVELGYEGQRLPIDDTRVPNDSSLWRHNGTLLGKVGPLIDQKWRPFVGAGVGLSYVNPSDNTSGVYDTDFQTELPLAAGVDYHFGNLFAGARATYRLVGGEELTTLPGTGQDAKGSIFNGNITLGGRF